MSETTEAARKLTDREVSDAVHRADFPRAALRALTPENDDPSDWGEPVATATIAATAVADHVEGVARVGSGPDPARGTPAWWRAYIAELDRRADALVPGWRVEPRSVGPFAWAAKHFGSVDPWGDEPEMPRDSAAHIAWIESGLSTSEWYARGGHAAEVPS